MTLETLEEVVESCLDESNGRGKVEFAIGAGSGYIVMKFFISLEERGVWWSGRNWVDLLKNFSEYPKGMGANK